MTTVQKRCVRGLLAALSLGLSAPGYAALQCGEPYTIKAGDTLGAIADKAYGAPGKYSAIYYANRDVLKQGPSLIQVGQVLSIPCIGADQTPPEKPEASAEGEAAEASVAEPSEAPAEEKQPVPEAVAKPSKKRKAKPIRFLTASDYRPFTDQSLPSGGMVTEMVERAMQSADKNYKMTWINDWSAHLSPLLSEKSYDMGFPWLDPGCPTDHPRCKFLFSDSVFEMLIALYVNKDNPIAFESDSDLEGKTLCRPSGYFVFDLDQDGRNWVKENKVKLERPQSVQSCFRMLLDGKVDGVTINDFTGREAIAAMGITDQVAAAPREISTQGMHVLIHRTHPKATIYLSQLNSGLRDLKASGEYDEILERHLAHYWQMIDQAVAERQAQAATTE